MFAAEIGKRRLYQPWYSQCLWHLDGVFARFNCETHYFWRAVDHDLSRRNIFKQNRVAALAEWRQLAVRFLQLLAFMRLVRFTPTMPEIASRTPLIPQNWRSRAIGENRSSEIGVSLYNATYDEEHMGKFG